MILNMILDIWSEVPVPQDWVEVIIIYLFKGKASKLVSEDYWRRILFEAVGKSFCKTS